MRGTEFAWEFPLPFNILNDGLLTVINAKSVRASRPGPELSLSEVLSGELAFPG